MRVARLCVGASLFLLFLPLSSFAQNSYTVVPQPTCAISVTPLLIASNSFATLTWATQYADRVTISGIGAVQPRGNTPVKAAYDRHFVIFANGKGGFCENSATLAVRDPYENYGYIAPTIQSIAYPLFGYQPVTYSTYPVYISKTWEYYDDDDDDDDYWDYYYAKPYEYPTYTEEYYYTKPYEPVKYVEEIYYVNPYADCTTWGGCWE